MKWLNKYIISVISILLIIFITVYLSMMFNGGLLLGTVILHCCISTFTQVYHLRTSFITGHKWWCVLFIILCWFLKEIVCVCVCLCVCVWEREREREREITMNQPETLMDFANPSGSKKLFDTLFTARVITKCHALQTPVRKSGSTTQRDCNQTIEGLTITEGYIHIHVYVHTKLHTYIYTHTHTYI